VTHVSSKKTISIIIPTLNEELAITKTLNDIPTSALKKMGYGVEVIVVDGMSRDATRERAAAAGAKVVIEPTKGYGIPIRTGVKHSRGDIIVKADGDWTYPLKRLPDLLDLLNRKNLDFICTDRLSTLNPETMSLRNRIGNMVLVWAVQIVFRLNLKDSQSGMWMIRRRAWDQLVLKRNLSFSQELKVEALHYAKLRSEQVPITYRSRLGKATYGNWQTGIFLIIALISLRVRRHHSPRSASVPNGQA
jgi:glycosyltransferase involved in cell wall biosynthesis